MRRELAGMALAGLVWVGGCDSNAVPMRESTPQASGVAGGQRQVDRVRGRVWELNLDGVTMRDIRTRGKVQLSLPDWIWVGPAYACMPDLALGPKGEVVITSNVVPTVWRVDPETLAVTMHPLALDADQDKDVGFTALAYSPAHAAYYGVGSGHRTLWKIDSTLTRAEKVAQPAAAERGAPCTEPAQLKGG